MGCEKVIVGGGSHVPPHALSALPNAEIVGLAKEA